MSTTALLCLTCSDERVIQAYGSSALSQLRVSYCRTHSFTSPSSDVFLFWRAKAFGLLPVSSLFLILFVALNVDSIHQIFIMISFLCK